MDSRPYRLHGDLLCLEAILELAGLPKERLNRWMGEDND